MSEKLYSSFLKTISNSTENPVYFINLRDIAPLRTRSCNYILTNSFIIDEEAQIILLNFKGEQWLVIRQPHIEGMLPYEYSLILKSLKKLEVSNINIYFEASALGDSSLNG